MPEISKTADLALVLLGTIAEEQPVTATVLCRRLGMNRTIAHRLLTTLHERSFVRRLGDDYTLGPATLNIARRTEPSLRRAALPVMEQLCAGLGETVILQVLDGDQVTVLDQVIGTRHVVRVEQNLIGRHPAHLGASGRVLLAFQPERTVQRALRALSAAESGRLRERLERIRALGHDVSHDELQDGVHAAAAPVLAPDDTAVAALAVLAPVSRDIDDAPGAVRTAAAQVRSALATAARPSPKDGEPTATG